VTFPSVNSYDSGLLFFFFTAMWRRIVWYQFTDNSQDRTSEFRVEIGGMRKQNLWKVKELNSKFRYCNFHDNLVSWVSGEWGRFRIWLVKQHFVVTHRCTVLQETDQRLSTSCLYEYIRTCDGFVDTGFWEKLCL
jgi:hypothetical protein